MTTEKITLLITGCLMTLPVATALAVPPSHQPPVTSVAASQRENEIRWLSQTTPAMASTTPSLPQNQASRSASARREQRSGQLAKVPAAASRPLATAAPQRQPAPVSSASPAAVVAGSNHNPVQANRGTSTVLLLRENALLSQELSAWAHRQGLRLLWNSDKDYLIFSNIALSGKGRDDVLNELGKLFLSENYGLVIKLYEANHVLIIDSQ